MFAQGWSQSLLILGSTNVIFPIVPSHGHEPTHQDWEWTEMLRNDIYKYEEPIHMPLEAKSGHEARTSAAPDMTPQ